jgi:hypothetical protein
MSRFLSEVTCQNEGHHEKAERAKNIVPSANCDPAHLSQTKLYAGEEEDDRCRVLLAIKLAMSTHCTTSMNTVYFPFHMTLTYILMQYY